MYHNNIQSHFYHKYRIANIYDICLCFNNTKHNLFLIYKYTVIFLKLKVKHMGQDTDKIHLFQHKVIHKAKCFHLNKNVIICYIVLFHLYKYSLLGIDISQKPIEKDKYSHIFSNYQNLKLLFF
jgi:hypothetical protein